MHDAPRGLLAQALALPEGQRAALAEAILASLSEDAEAPEDEAPQGPAGVPWGELRGET